MLYYILPLEHDLCPQQRKTDSNKFYSTHSTSTALFFNSNTDLNTSAHVIILIDLTQNKQTPFKDTKHTDLNMTPDYCYSVICSSLRKFEEHIFGPSVLEMWDSLCPVDQQCSPGWGEL